MTQKPHSAPAASPEPPPEEGCNLRSCPPLVPGIQKKQQPHPFRFKQFTVTQERSAMKIGTDGVLLGAWVSLGFGQAATSSAVTRVLDIGTGTGVIALMIAQRIASSSAGAIGMPAIDAVEVDSEAAAEASRNFETSPWRLCFKAYTMPIQQYASEYRREKYDLIVSNPPYFIAGIDFRRGFDVSAAPPSAARIAARHAEMLPYDELIVAVLLLLAPGGRFAAIFPYQESGVFIAKAAAQGLFVSRMLDIHGAPHKPVKRVAVEFSLLRPRKKADIVRETLCIEDARGDFSAAYRTLTSEFYLKF